MARMDAMTMKMDAQYKDFQSHLKQLNLGDDDIPMSREEESKFMQTFRRTHFYNDYRDRYSNRDNWHSSGRNDYNRDNYQSHSDDKPTKFDRLADKQFGRPSGSLPSNPKGSSSKPYQPLQARNEHVNVVFTWSGKSYDPPENLNDQQNDSETPINFDSDDEDDEPTPQPKPKTPEPYKPKIPYPQCLRKEKMEAQYGKFLDMI
ncbi:hypothetical protein Tco_1024854 [Tanacetum coccineum]